MMNSERQGLQGAHSCSASLCHFLSLSLRHTLHIHASPSPTRQAAGSHTLLTVSVARGHSGPGAAPARLPPEVPQASSVSSRMICDPL